MHEKLDIMRGSGNVFRDVGHPNADVEQIKAILAANMIGVLDDVELSTRAAEAVTGVSHSEFARIRRVKLDRFTIDWLITILNRLNQRVEVEVTVRPAPNNERPAQGVE